MTLHRAWSDARGRWRLLTIYQRFEHAVISLLTLLIAVVLILVAMLAVVRKLALGSAILALGAVHWLVREQDRRERGAGTTRQEG